MPTPKELQKWQDWLPKFSEWTKKSSASNTNTIDAEIEVLDGRIKQGIRLMTAAANAGTADIGYGEKLREWFDGLLEHLRTDDTAYEEVNRKLYDEIKNFLALIDRAKDQKGLFTRTIEGTSRALLEAFVGAVQSTPDIIDKYGAPPLPPKPSESRPEQVEEKVEVISKGFAQIAKERWGKIFKQRARSESSQSTTVTSDSSQSTVVEEEVKREPPPMPPRPDVKTAANSKPVEKRKPPEIPKTRPGEQAKKKTPPPLPEFRPGQRNFAGNAKTPPAPPMRPYTNILKNLQGDMVLIGKLNNPMTPDHVIQAYLVHEKKFTKSEAEQVMKDMEKFRTDMGATPVKENKSWSGASYIASTEESLEAKEHKGNRIGQWVTSALRIAKDNASFGITTRVFSALDEFGKKIENLKRTTQKSSQNKADANDYGQKIGAQASMLMHYGHDNSNVSPEERELLNAYKELFNNIEKTLSDTPDKPLSKEARELQGLIKDLSIYMRAQSDESSPDLSSPDVEKSELAKLKSYMSKPVLSAFTGTYGNYENFASRIAELTVQVLEKDEPGLAKILPALPPRRVDNSSMISAKLKQVNDGLEKWGAQFKSMLSKAMQRTQTEAKAENNTKHRNVD